MPIEDDVLSVLECLGDGLLALVRRAQLILVDADKAEPHQLLRNSTLSS